MPNPMSDSPIGQRQTAGKSSFAASQASDHADKNGGKENHLKASSSHITAAQDHAKAAKGFFHAGQHQEALKHISSAENHGSMALAHHKKASEAKFSVDSDPTSSRRNAMSEHEARFAADSKPASDSSMGLRQAAEKSSAEATKVSERATKHGGIENHTAAIAAHIKAVQAHSKASMSFSHEDKPHDSVRHISASSLHKEEAEHHFSMAHEAKFTADSSRASESRSSADFHAAAAVKCERIGDYPGVIFHLRGEKTYREKARQERVHFTQTTADFGGRGSEYEKALDAIVQEYLNRRA